MVVLDDGHRLDYSMPAFMSLSYIYPLASSCQTLNVSFNRPTPSSSSPSCICSRLLLRSQTNIEYFIESAFHPPPLPPFLLFVYGISNIQAYWTTPGFHLLFDCVVSIITYFSLCLILPQMWHTPTQMLVYDAMNR